MDISIKELKNKLAEIEARIEDENSRGRPNRMAARYFMFFILLGGDEEARSILERKVKELLCNPDACEFLQITQGGAAPDGKVIEEVLLDAARNHVDVQNLNRVLLCPVIFANSHLGGDIVPMLTEIDSYMNRSGHEPTWQPTIITNKNVSQYKNIHFCVTEMIRFISTMPETQVNRCCWLSDTDEKGFSVPMENIMQTVAMVAVLQNVVTQSADDSQTIRSKVSHTSTAEDGHHLFFTARNAAVTNPLRSLLLQRLSAAMDYFAGSSSTNAVSRIRYSFVQEIMLPYLSLLPHHGGRITLLPLFSLIADNTLYGRLEQLINERYLVPLCGPEARKKQLEQARQRFLESFFALDGSLDELKTLLSEQTLAQVFLDHKKECYGDIPVENPFVDRRKLSEFANGLYGQSAMACLNRINDCGWSLLEDMGKDILQSNMLRTITDLQDALEQIRQCIQNRMRQLRDVETVLVVDQTEQRTNFGEIQADWMENTARNNQEKYSQLNMHFDRTVFQLLQSEEADLFRLLDICYEAVKNTAPSNSEYMAHVGDECMKNDLRTQEFINLVEKSWCYTLRFLNQEENKGTTCIIGDDRNQFCRSLQERFRGSLFSFSGFDRIDILHISGAFSPESVFEWAQIESSGKGAQEV